MKKILNSKGVSIIESVVAVTIISFTLVMVFTLIINSRTQSLATKKEVYAIEVASRIRDNLQYNVDYQDLSNWLDGDTKTVVSSTCEAENPFFWFNTMPFSCDLIQFEIDNVPYENDITVQFIAQNSDDLQFHTISFVIIINYYSQRNIRLEGIIYEK